MKEKYVGLFSNIEKKIKTLAHVLGVIALAGGFLAFLITAFDYGIDEPEPWLYLAGGIIGYFLSWPLYGFGELIEAAKKIANDK